MAGGGMSFGQNSQTWGQPAQPNYATPQAASYQPTMPFNQFGYSPLRQYGYNPYQQTAFNPYQGYNPFQYVGSSPGYGGLSSYTPQYQQMGMYLNSLRFPSFQQPYLAPMGGAQGYAGSGGTAAPVAQAAPAVAPYNGWYPGATGAPGLYN